MKKTSPAAGRKGQKKSPTSGEWVSTQEYNAEVKELARLQQLDKFDLLGETLSTPKKRVRVKKRVRAKKKSILRPNRPPARVFGGGGGVPANPLAGAGGPAMMAGFRRAQEGEANMNMLKSMTVDDMIARAQEGIARNQEANSELEQNILHAYGHLNPNLIASRRINYPETNLHWQAPEMLSLGQNVGPEGQKFSLNIAGYTNSVGPTTVENLPQLYDPYEQYRGVFGQKREGDVFQLRDFVKKAPVTQPGKPAPISQLEQNMALLDTQALYEKIQRRRGTGDSLRRMITGMPVPTMRARN